MALQQPQPEFLVYIAGPYSGRDQESIDANIARAVEVAVAVAEMGAYPVCPHANTAHPKFGKARDYRFWLDATSAMLRRCDAVIFVEGWESSYGSRCEFVEAARRKMPIFYNVAELEGHLASAASAAAAS